jgi:hypothetical protein
VRAGSPSLSFVQGAIELFIRHPGSHTVRAPTSGPVAAELNWHIGATRIRFRSVLPRIVSGLKSVGIGSPLAAIAVPGEMACWGVK